MLVHLSEEELAGLLTGDDYGNAARHLAICPACQLKLEGWKDSLRQFRSDVFFSSHRPQDYWLLQRNAITQKLEKHLARGWKLGWTMACSALALLVAVLALFNFQPDKTALQHHAEMSDAALWNDVEDRVSEDLPEALQPAELLVSEMGAMHARSKQTKAKKAVTTLR